MSDVPKEVEAKAAAVKTSVLTKLNTGWQWLHGEAYHFGQHAKDGAWIVAALAFAYLALKVGTHF